MFEEIGLLSGTAYNATGEAEAGMGVTAGDFDNDGDEDLFVTHLAKETNTLYRNDGRGSFLDSTTQLGLAHISLSLTDFGTQWLDYDNDSDLDLFVANGAVTIVESLLSERYPYHQKNQLFENQGNSGFEEVSSNAGLPFELSEVSRGAAFGDIDNDGDIDIVVSNNNGPVRLLINETDSKNHWVQFRLQGVGANRSGIGARLALLREDRKPLWSRMHSDGSYLSANDLRVHFGLGRDPNVRGIVLHWPDGQKEFWGNVRADSMVSLRQGSGRPWDQ